MICKKWQWLNLGTNKFQKIMIKIENGLYNIIKAQRDPKG